MMPSDLSSLLREHVVLMEELDRRRRTNLLAKYRPYRRQLEFHAAGARYRERLFMAGNQLGKTLAGAAEAAMHLTGRYPDWWQCKRFSKPVVMIAGSESYELTRDGVQRLMIGPPMNEEDWGTGYHMKRAHPLIFWPQFVWETVRKHVALAGTIMRLAAAAYRISRDPASKLYVDQALTPVGAAEEETLDLFTKTAGGTAAVAHVRRVAVFTHATGGSRR